MTKRNAELHSGNNVFEGGDTNWQSTYYQACKILLEAIGENLEEFFGEEHSSSIEETIEAAQDESAKAVKKTVSAYSVIWADKTSDEQTTLFAQASSWSLKRDGHKVTCPACSCDALLNGVAIAAPIIEMSNDEVIEKQEYQPSNFECVGCGLKISGLSQLIACGLGGSFTGTFNYDLGEYYMSNDPWQGYEPDFNEP